MNSFKQRTNRLDTMDINLKTEGCRTPFRRIYIQGPIPIYSSIAMSTIEQKTPAKSHRKPNSPWTSQNSSTKSTTSSPTSEIQQTTTWAESTPSTPAHQTSSRASCTRIPQMTGKTTCTRRSCWRNRLQLQRLESRCHCLRSCCV